MLLQDTSVIFSNAAIPTLQSDAMMRPGAIHLFDFNDYPACNPSNVRPSNHSAGTSFTNLISGKPAAVTIGPYTQNASATSTGGDGLLIESSGNSGMDLGGANYDLYNKAWVKLLWFKQKTGHPTTHTQCLSHRSNGSSAIGSMQHAIYMASGGDHLTALIASPTASVSYDFGVTALDTVTQIGIAYNPSTGIMQAIKNGVIVASVALTGGGNLCQPSGTVLDRIGNGFGANFVGHIYRQYTEDLGSSGAAVADIAMLDYLAMAARFS